MEKTYEILLRKGETSDKRKIEIREVATGREISCEVDAKKIKLMKGFKVKHMKDSEPVYSKVRPIPR